jgi:methanogenic corrinoid protein MtbC1
VANNTLIQAIADLKEDTAIKIVKQRLVAGENPVTLISESQEAMRLVGKHYQEGKYYLSGLIMGGEIFREVTELVKPVISAQVCGSSRGTVLLGTVEGDIHDLGKNIVKILLECHKFIVYDLGVDVPVEVFTQKAKEIHPDIIGLSGILTLAFDSMRKTIVQLHEEGISAPIVIGGSQIDAGVCLYTGADYWAVDASSGIELCRRLVSR